MDVSLLRVAAIMLVVSCVSIGYSLAAGPKVSELGNKHNLSSSNTAVTYKATVDPANARSNQICIFCHTPHNSRPQTVLWNRADTVTVFGRYSSASLVIRGSTEAQYGEPNGSSRLCLSCHDGVTALGDVLSGGPINFGVNDKITGIAKFDANKVKNGHHPISFYYKDAALLTALNAKTGTFASTYTFPTDATVPADVQAAVKLDKEKRMQCTTCHDPHQNRSDDATVYPATTRKVVPFWVYTKSGNTAAQDHDAVCKACHLFTMYDPSTSTQPWPTP